MIIKRLICLEFKITHECLVGRVNLRKFVRPRHIAQWLCKQCTKRSTPEIGRLFDGRDHSTILHAIRRVEFLRKNPNFDSLVTRLRAQAQAEIAAERARVRAANESCQRYGQITFGPRKES